MPGWEEEVFPSKRSLDENGLKGLEEERRLAYVGITRARERCYISFVANRQIYGRWQSVLPSRFVDELPHEHVDAVSETGYGAAGSGFGEGFTGAAEDLGENSTYSSPGWRRMQENSRAQKGMSDAAPRILEGDAKIIANSNPGSSGFAIGQRVFHDKFGYGHVKTVEGSKLSVEFKTGVKKVISTFLVAA